MLSILTNLRPDYPLHDGEEGLGGFALVNSLEPLVPVFISSLQAHVQVVVRLLCRQVLSNTSVAIRRRREIPDTN